MKFYSVVLRNGKTYFVITIGEFLKLYIRKPNGKYTWHSGLKGK